MKHQCKDCGEQMVADPVVERNNIIELLESYSKFLEENGYIDADWRTEQPYAIDTFLMEQSKKS